MKHARPDYDRRIQDSARLIPDDEPVLLIRGQDRCALAAINTWLTAAKVYGVDDHTLTMVRLHRSRIAAWQAEHGSKIPDAPIESPETPAVTAEVYAAAAEMNLLLDAYNATPADHDDADMISEVDAILQRAGLRRIE